MSHMPVASSLCPASSERVYHHTSATGKSSPAYVKEKKMRTRAMMYPVIGSLSFPPLLVSTRTVSCHLHPPLQLHVAWICSRQSPCIPQGSLGTKKTDVAKPC